MGYYIRSLPENPFPLILANDGTYAVVEPDAWAIANGSLPASHEASRQTRSDPHGVSALVGSLRYAASHVSRLEAATKYSADYAAEDITHKHLLKIIPAASLQFRISATPGFNKKTRADLAFCAIQAFLYSSSRLQIRASGDSSASNIYLIAEKPGKVVHFFTANDMGKTLYAFETQKIRDVEVSLKKVVLHLSDNQVAITRDAVFA